MALSSMETTGRRMSDQYFEKKESTEHTIIVNNGLVHIILKRDNDFMFSTTCESKLLTGAFYKAAKLIRDLDESDEFTWCKL